MIIPQNNYIVLKKVEVLEFEGIKQNVGWNFGEIVHDHKDWKQGDILLVGPDVRGGKHIIEIGDGYMTCKEDEVRGKYE